MARSKRQPEYRFDLSGGVLCLDFANTVSNRFDPMRRAEHLRSFADLLVFARQSNIITLNESKAYLTLDNGHDNQTRRAFRRALQFREILYRAFAALANGKPIPARDFGRINNVATRALANRTLIAANRSFRWVWTSTPGNLLDRILWMIAQSAAELLTSGELDALRQCHASNCDWLFVDHSRNRSRRWCDMKSCGNRQKARRHYRRTHED